MAQLPVKKKRQPPVSLPADPECCVRFPGVVLCLVEKKMGLSRKAFLATLAQRKGFCVEEASSERVTHVVSEGNSGGEVVEWLKRKSSPCMEAVGHGVALLDLSWFTESMSAGRPVEIEPRHRLQVAAHAKELEGQCQVWAYACQRRTPLEHNHQMLTEALEILAEEAHFWGSEGRSLAFSRAASVLKSLPWTVRKIQDLKSLPCIGEHSRRVIQEILEDGVSSEVEKIRQSERYQTMKLFTKIFGVGVKTASRWHQEGLRTLADLQAHHTKLSKEQQAGLLHYEDLSTPVTFSEAEAIGQLVRDVVEQCLPGASVTLTGGFRRGKQSGHDVDLLLTHPVDGQEIGLLGKVIAQMDRQGFLLYHSIHRNTFQSFEDEAQEIRDSTTSMDHFERCFSIFCLGCFPGGIPRSASEARRPSNTAQVSGTTGSWKAVRVDLVVTPCSQFPFALLGWTGSQNFERDLRRFSKHEKKMTLNSHALYDKGKRTFLTAASEEEIFNHLDLEYIPPKERNA
nr:PREDICTED: DNA-directed DNA/RNA polymerase mu-like [Anolis carolinensis]|eukprot:XP_008119518.1 PREDICTED: DNA-directed DNA/RNA polymerase mu-like [Anolis carolinensis]